MGMGAAPATRKLLERTGLTLADIDLFEIDEAFAAQDLAVEKDLGLPRDIVNVNGGAIALGHPLGMTGTRLLLTLSLEMRAGARAAAWQPRASEEARGSPRWSRRCSDTVASGFSRKIT